MAHVKSKTEDELVLLDVEPFSEIQVSIDTATPEGREWKKWKMKKEKLARRSISNRDPWYDERG